MRVVSRIILQAGINTINSEREHLFRSETLLDRYIIVVVALISNVSSFEYGDAANHRITSVDGRSTWLTVTSSKVRHHHARVQIYRIPGAVKCPYPNRDVANRSHHAKPGAWEALRTGQSLPSEALEKCSRVPRGQDQSVEAFENVVLHIWLPLLLSYLLNHLLRLCFLCSFRF